MKLANRITNPEIFAENRMLAHSDHIFYANKEEYLQGSSSYVHSLNGIWKFTYSDSPKDAIEGFQEMDYCCKNWQDIPVPAHIQMQGYDKPQYANVEYPWEGVVPIKLGEVPVDFNPIASYVKYFQIPENFKGKRVFISFQGVEQAVEIWLNGKYIGYGEDSFTPSEYEITENLIAGENKLALRVYKWSSAAWLEDQDFFRFSGIFREVYLYAIEDCHLYDLKIIAEPSQDLQSGTLSISADIWGEGEISFALREYQYDFYQHQIIEKNPDELPLIWEQSQTVTQGLMEVEAQLPNIRLWSAEKPNLYLLTIYLKKNEQVIEFIPQLVGFRKFEIDGNIMKLNGKRIVFHGVNRHEFGCDQGRVIQVSDMIKDAITMKQNNINAVRTSHYPNRSEWYRICDIYGIYMIDETNLETHGTWGDLGGGVTDPEKLARVLPGDDKKWLGAVLDRVNSMFQRDKNHPAILMWSLGNESYGGKNIFEMSKLLRELDPTRVIHYEGVTNDPRYPETTDVYSQMYTPADQVRSFLEMNQDKPFILCEYTHAMGNSNGGMDKYIRLSEQCPTYQGGFIWDYVDQAIRTKNVFGEDYMGYGGDFKDRPNDGNFSGNGIVFANREVTPKMQEVKFNYQNFKIFVEESKVSIENKSLFTCSCEYRAIEKLYCNGQLIAIKPFATKVEPLSKEVYDLPIPVPKGNGEYTVIISLELKEDTLWAKAGHEVAFGQGIFGKYTEFETQRQALAQEQEKDLLLIQDKTNVGVRGTNFSILFNDIHGGLISYKYGGREMLRDKIMPNFWRAPVDNDYGNCMPQRYGQWKLASQYITHKPFVEGLRIGLLSAEQKSDHIEIRYGYGLPTTPVASCETKWCIFADGSVEVELIYPVIPELKDMPEFGMMFQLYPEYKHITWYGYGPESNYADRQAGVKLGIYENQAEDNVIPYLRPQESGAKLGVRYAKICDNSGRGICFYGEPFGLSVTPYTPHEIENANHGYELPRPYQTVARVFSEQMGIAGDDSWGAKTHPEYLVDVSQSVKSFKFKFVGTSNQGS